MIRLKIGDVLIEQGLIKQEHLDRALAIQQQTGSALGEILVKNGFLSEEDLTKALSRQFGYPYASRANGLLVISDKDRASNVIPSDLGRDHAIVPLFV